ncbi:MAG: RNA methyltransferase [Flavobacteriales bacterium]|nr:RNA methyltransferase [Flavobacteriales bacterium]
MEKSARKLKNIELNRLSVDKFKDSEKLPLVVILDNIRSLNNVGSVFRTCDCMGIGKVYLCGITGTPPHRDIHKTSLGAENSVLWEYEKDILKVIQHLKSKGFTIAGLEQTDQSLDIRKHPWDNEPLALIIGNEIDGIGDEAIGECERLFEIPQYGTKHSFNVAVSVGIALWELTRLAKRRP